LCIRNRCKDTLTQVKYCDSLLYLNSLSLIWTGKEIKKNNFLNLLMPMREGLAKEVHWRGRPSIVDLLVLTILDQLLLIYYHYLPFYKITYLNEEVSCTEPSPLVSIPQFGIKIFGLFCLLEKVWVHEQPTYMSYL
jgi:hypothetical protein